jgi:diguanylate cyclase (GGDEF)-like protein
MISSLIALFEPIAVMLTGGVICFLMSTILVWQAHLINEYKNVLLTLAACMMGGTIALFFAVSDSVSTHPLTKFGSNAVGTATYLLAISYMLQLYRANADRTASVALGALSLLGCITFTSDNSFYAWNQFMRIAIMFYTAWMLYNARDTAAPGLRFFSLALPILSIFGMAPQLIFLLASVNLAALPLIDSTSDASRAQAISWTLSPALVYIAVMGVIQARIAYRLRESAYLDILTGAHSRRYLIERGAQLISQRDANDARQGTSLLLIDVDHFKQINDTWGHSIGDAVLRHCVSCIREVVRSHDSVVSRYGGEEFCVLLPNTSLAAATLVAERTRAEIAQRPYIHGDHEIRITVSIGAAMQKHTTCTLASVLSQADHLMYQAKEAGRNRVMTSLQPT